jgi:hypothetical protein
VSLTRTVNTLSSTPGRLTKTSGAAAWDAGAESQAAFDVRTSPVSGIAFRPAQNGRNLMVGLEAQRPVSDEAAVDYTTLDYAIHLTSSGTVLLWKEGALVGRLSGAGYRKDDLVEVAVNRQSRVEYRINGQVRFTASQTVPVGPLSARLVIFDVDAGVTDVAWVDKSAWCRGVSCAAESTCVGAVCELGKCSGGCQFT